MSLFSVVDFSLSAIVLMLAVCRGVEFELRSFGLFFSKLRSCDIGAARKRREFFLDIGFSVVKCVGNENSTSTI